MSIVRIKELYEANALYYKYDNEVDPQRCWLSLNTQTGYLWCDWDGAIGGGATPERYYRVVLEATIPCINAKAANTLLKEAAPLAQIVLDGANIEWIDGNSVGTLTETAQNAWEQIERLCEPENFSDADFEMPSGIPAAEWFADGPDGARADHDIDADTTDFELRAAASKAVTDAEAEDFILEHGDVLAYLKELRDEDRQKVRDQLDVNVVQLGSLSCLRDQQINQINRWGLGGPDSMRALGERVGVSAQQIQRIVAGFGVPNTAYRFEIEVSNEDGTAWQSVESGREKLAITPQDFADWVANNQSVVDGDDWRVQVFIGSTSETCAEAGPAGKQIPGAIYPHWSVDRGRYLVDFQNDAELAADMVRELSPAGESDVSATRDPADPTKVRIAPAKFSELRELTENENGCISDDVDGLMLWVGGTGYPVTHIA